MGLFDAFKKKNCDICGGEIGLLGNRKLADGNCCKTCAGKLSYWFDERRSSTVEQIREQLKYREENFAMLQEFRPTRVIGEYNPMFFDETTRRFFVARNEDYLAENPDILSYDQVLGCELRIDETRTEIMREIKERDGSVRKVSYNPRRYLFSYEFEIVMGVQSPYFDEIYFRLNRNTVEVEMGGTKAGSALYRNLGIMDPTVDIDYRTYAAMGEEIVRILTGAPENVQPPEEPAQQEAPAAFSTNFCPHCGAPYNGGKFCRNCGGKI